MVLQTGDKEEGGFKTVDRTMIIAPRQICFPSKVLKIFSL